VGGGGGGGEQGRGGGEDVRCRGGGGRGRGKKGWGEVEGVEIKAMNGGDTEGRKRWDQASKGGSKRNESVGQAGKSSVYVLGLPLGGFVYPGARLKCVPVWMMSVVTERRHDCGPGRLEITTRFRTFTRPKPRP